MTIPEYINDENKRKYSMKQEWYSQKISMHNSCNFFFIRYDTFENILRMRHLPTAGGSWEDQRRDAWTIQSSAFGSPFSSSCRSRMALILERETNKSRILYFFTVAWVTWKYFWMNYSISSSLNVNVYVVFCTVMEEI